MSTWTIINKTKGSKSFPIIDVKKYSLIKWALKYLLSLHEKHLYEIHSKRKNDYFKKIKGKNISTIDSKNACFLEEVVVLRPLFRISSTLSKHEKTKYNITSTCSKYILSRKNALSMPMLHATDKTMMFILFSGWNNTFHQFSKSI